MAPKVDTLEETRAKVRELVTRRAVLKRRVTVTFKKAENNNLDFSILQSSIEGYLAEIKSFDDKINDLFLDISNFDPQFSEDSVIEFDSQTEYQLDVKSNLLVYKPLVNNPVPHTTSVVTNCDLKLPELKCDTFSGEGSTQLDFHSFISQFNNVVGRRVNLTNSAKFTYLKSYLKGYASKLVEHLQISDDNYPKALELLNI